MLADMDEDSLIEEIGDADDDGTAAYFGGDLRQKLTVANLLSATIDRFDRVDILVNASRQMVTGDPLNADDDGVGLLIEQNLMTSLRVSQLFAKRMIKQAKDVEQDGLAGSIINLSSIAARRTQPELLAYSVSSAALDQMTRSMAVALAPHRIRVNAIATWLGHERVAQGGARRRGRHARRDRDLDPARSHRQPLGTGRRGTVSGLRWIGLRDGSNPDGGWRAYTCRRGSCSSALTSPQARQFFAEKLPPATTQSAQNLAAGQGRRNGSYPDRLPPGCPRPIRQSPSACPDPCCPQGSHLHSAAREMRPCQSVRLIWSRFHRHRPSAGK